MDDRLADGPDVDVVRGSGQVGRTQVGDRDLERLGEVDPQTVARDIGESSQRTSAWPPFSCGRMYGTYWSATVDDQTPMQSAALAVRVRLMRPGSRTSGAPRDPGQSSSTVPTRARSREHSGISAVSVTVIAAVGEGAVPRLVLDRHAAGRSRTRRRRPSSSPSRLMDSRWLAQTIDTPVGPAACHPADPVVVGRGAPQAQGRRNGDQRVDQLPAPRRPRALPSRPPAHRSVRLGGRPPLPGRQLEDTDLEPRRRPRQLVCCRDGDRQERLARRRKTRGRPARQLDLAPTRLARAPAGRTMPDASSTPAAVSA